MAVKINGPVPPGNVGRPNSRPGVKRAEEGRSAESRSEKVDLSGKEAAVDVVKTASRDVKDVDEAKIARLRAEIQSGQYSADLKVVAEKIISEAVQLKDS